MSAAKKAPEPEMQFAKDEIVCPYCLYTFSDSWESCSEDSSEVECHECEKTFEVERNHDVTYTSSPMNPPYKETHAQKCDRQRKKLGAAPMGFKKGEKPLSPRSGELRILLHKIAVTDAGVEGCEKSPEMAAVLQNVLARLHGRGFAVELDPDTLKNYPSLAHGYWLGKKGELCARASGAFGRNIDVEFFREGERYGSHNQLMEMPVSLRLACLVEMTAVTKLLLDHGYTLGDDHGLQRASVPLPLRVRDAALGSYKLPLLEQYQKNQWKSSKRDEHGFLAESEYLSSQDKALDRDGVRLHAGDERCFYHWNGRLMRGHVYPGINNNWFVWFGGDEHTSVEARKLFSWTEAAPRRLVRRQAERVESELQKSVKVKDWKRAGVLAGVLARGGLTS